MFEQEVKSYLKAKGIAFDDRTASLVDLDFHLPNHGIHIETKEKRQPSALKNWPEAKMPQEHLFVLDDLAARKLLVHAPASFVLICDSSVDHRTYHVYSVVDLLCIPKVRCRRPIKKTVAAFKGKWVVDLRDAAAFFELADAMDYILSYPQKFKSVFETHIDCWGRYHTETLPTDGSLRTPEYWTEDNKLHD